MDGMCHGGAASPAWESLVSNGHCVTVRLVGGFTRVGKSVAKRGLVLCFNPNVLVFLVRMCLYLSIRRNDGWGRRKDGEVPKGD